MESLAAEKVLADQTVAPEKIPYAKYTQVRVQDPDSDNENFEK